uniref:NADH-ubiquinone oxidoreductase chain 2 n=1 Tax=Plesiolebias aruana TaxID=61831 RepID=Q9TD15_9TELE|nr:NADH dehydrogenase subunit II [Plesiolebias aruana]
MNPFLLTIVIISLTTGTLITITSSHWILAWLGLEINTFAILPMMIHMHSPRKIEVTVKYFIIQTIATMLILFATIMNAWVTGEWEIKQTNLTLPLLLISLALMLKMGLAPLHAWFTEAVQSSDFLTGLILSTWQKFAPLTLLLQLTTKHSTITITIGLLSILIGGLGGLNQTQTRKILSYSSIAHLGWMILISQYIPLMAFTTFVIYTIMNFSMFFMLFLSQSTSIKILTTIWVKTPSFLFIMPLILLSLGGLPPLTGFLPKWMILSELLKQSLTPFATMAAMASLLSLYFYLRMAYMTAMTTSPNLVLTIVPWRITSLYPPVILAISSSLSLYILPLSPAIMIMTCL